MTICTSESIRSCPVCGRPQDCCAEVDQLREERDTWEQRAIMAEEVAHSAQAELRQIHAEK